MQKIEFRMIRATMVGCDHPGEPILLCFLRIRGSRINPVGSFDRLGRILCAIVCRTPMTVNVGVARKPRAPLILSECKHHPHEDETGEYRKAVSHHKPHFALVTFGFDFVAGSLRAGYRRVKTYGARSLSK